MNLTKLTLRNSRIAVVVLLVVAAIGISNYFKLERDSMPPYTIRLATVVTHFPGATPSEVEVLVSEPLEEAIREIAEVKTITSESRSELSVITVELLVDVNRSELQGVWTSLRNKVNEVRSSLPTHIQGPVVKDEDIGKVFGVILGVTGEAVPYHILEDYAKSVREDMLQLADVAKIKLGGVQEERIYIELDDRQLAQNGLTSEALRKIIASTNILLPGGDINVGRKRIALEPSGSFEQLSDLEQLLVPTGMGGTVYLKDLTTRIHREYISPSEKVVKINGQKAIALFISLKEGANIVRLGEDIDKAIPAINQRLPLGVEVVRSASQDHVVKGQVNDFLKNLVQSVVIVLAVMLFFMGFRTGSLVAALLPMVILSTFFFLNILDIGLNKVSLAALIISLGLLVDNGIVVAESILVNLKKGMTVFDAAVDAGKLLLIPLLISSLTTASAFLPFALAATPMGEISSPLFWVVSTTILGSWILAFTFIPLLALVLVKTKQASDARKTNLIDSYMEKLNRWYSGVLFHVLQKPFVFLGFISFLFVVALFSMQYLPFKLVPDSDRNLVTIDLKFPSGTHISYTETAVDAIGHFIAENLLVTDADPAGTAGVVDYSAFIGEGPEPYDLGYFKDEVSSNYAHILLNTTGDLDNDYIISRVDSFCLNHFPDGDIRVNRLTGAGASGTPVEIRISGSEPDSLAKIAEEVKAQLVATDGTKNVSDDWGPKIMKLVVDVDEDRARRYGLTNMEIASSLNAGLSGVKIGSYYATDEEIPIFLRSADQQDVDVSALNSYTLYASASGQKIPLSQVADVRVGWQFAKVKRRELRRTITVGSYLQTGYNASDVFAALGPWMETEKVGWPAGYDYEFGGEDEDTNENLGAIFSNLPLAFFLIVVLLVLQFNSFRKTTIIVLTIPLGLIGAIAGWYIGGSFVSFFGVLGVIALAGIVINNAIILIDRIEVELNENLQVDRRAAILKAANNRFRPVLLTTLTTSLGMLPLLFGGGLLWEPLTLAIIFGLLFATLITLLFVPVLYRLFYRITFNDYVYDKQMFD